MAVCGRCWICGSKFECAELRSCGCVGSAPLEATRGEVEHKICGRCERDIDSGAIGSLVEALRSIRNE